jgi:Ran GTPase-activating protein (RanGAP) involved in mRNA processing and transport
MNSNHLGVGGGKALAEGLKGNNVITELNIADLILTYDGEDMSGIIILADVIKDMGAMMKIDISSNCLCAAGGKALAEALKNNHVVTELSIASNYLGTADGDKLDMSGVIALANAIPDMRALTKLNTSNNCMPPEQKGELQRICTAGGIELSAV